MKKSVLVPMLGVLAAWSAAAGAQEVGRVISSTPVIQQVAVPRQVCTSQPVAVQQPSSGAGAVLGTIAGGLLGNQIGHGGGRAAATAIGAIGGALVGNSIEGQGQPQVQHVPQCTTQTSYENRTLGYDVVYEYAGREYNARMPYDPGHTIQLQLSPVGANAPYASDNTATYSGAVQPAYVAPQPAVVAGAYPAYPYPVYPVYPRPYYAPYYPPIGISLGFGFSSGHRHRGHWR